MRRGKSERGTTKFHAYATVCVVVHGWRYTLAIANVQEKEKPTEVLERLWAQVEQCQIACKMVLLDRYFFTVPVMKWLQGRELPFIIPVVMRGRKPKRGTRAKGMRGCRRWRAGTHPYTHRSGTDSVDFQLVVTYKSYRHHRTKKRGKKKMFFATWKVRRSPVAIREEYRKRFGIETSYRQLNQSRSRTSSRDPLYRFLLVGLSLFLRNVWQWLVRLSAASPHGRQGEPRPNAPRPPRYQDVLDAFTDYLQHSTQTHDPKPHTT